MVVKTDPVHELVSKLAHLSTETVKESVATPTNTPARNVQPESPFATVTPPLSNATSAAAGSKILFATDEWFASADCLLQDGPPIFDPDLFCQEGKVMDGWESRRRREAGHDWGLISLAERATIYGIEIDTAHFTGNNAPQVCLQVADLSAAQTTSLVAGLPGALERLLHGGRQGVGHTPDEVAEAEAACTAEHIKWKELLPKTNLQPGYEESRMHYFTLPQELVGTHVRVNFYPDGGVARLRLWATSADKVVRETKAQYLPIMTGKLCTVVPHSSVSTEAEMPSRRDYEFMELSASTNGGQGLACSNKHYGVPHNLIAETLGKDMGDGWETARHPDRPSILVKDPTTNLIDSPLQDWAILKLGKIAVDGVARVILDTKHFRGNYPESVLLEGCFAEQGMTDDRVSDQGEWFPLINRTRMAPDSEHVFETDLQQLGNPTRAVTHVRVSIFPDGGLSRVRIYGKPLKMGEDGVRSNL
jgi:allantoicase